MLTRYNKGMEHTNKEKSERNQELLDYMREHPEATMKDAGDVFGLTRQRVFRILSKYGRHRTCENCYHYIESELCRYHGQVNESGPCVDWRTRVKGAMAGPRELIKSPDKPLEGLVATRSDTLQAIRLRKEKSRTNHTL